MVHYRSDRSSRNPGEWTVSLRNKGVMKLTVEIFTFLASNSSHRNLYDSANLSWADSALHSPGPRIFRFA